MEERLQKFLARAGVASRRQAEEIIKAGLVKVNKQVVTEMGMKIDPRRDVIIVEGREIKLSKVKLYLMLYKPLRVVTTVKDPQNRNKVTDLLKGIEERVYPVGRLDYMTEGLLLLTNDGELAYRLTHPSYKVEKTYLALVQGIPGKSTLEKLQSGVQLEDGITAPVKVKLLSREKDKAWLELTIHEGRNRQVRRMCEAVGHPVQELKRIRFGPLVLGSLRQGEYRYLSEGEIGELRKACQLD